MIFLKFKDFFLSFDLFICFLNKFWDWWLIWDSGLCLILKFEVILFFGELKIQLKSFKIELELFS